MTSRGLAAACLWPGADMHDALFDGLVKPIEQPGWELPQFIEEQCAEMGQRMNRFLDIDLGS